MDRPWLRTTRSRTSTDGESTWRGITLSQSCLLLGVIFRTERDGGMSSRVKMPERRNGRTRWRV
eukprot:7588042-Alexandrium_andersonii.AAC.1